MASARSTFESTAYCPFTGIQASHQGALVCRKKLMSGSSPTSDTPIDSELCASFAVLPAEPNTSSTAGTMHAKGTRTSMNPVNSRTPKLNGMPNLPSGTSCSASQNPASEVVTAIRFTPLTASHLPIESSAVVTGVVSRGSSVCRSRSPAVTSRAAAIAPMSPANSA